MPRTLRAWYRMASEVEIDLMESSWDKRVIAASQLRGEELKEGGRGGKATAEPYRVLLLW